MDCRDVSMDGHGRTTQDAKVEQSLPCFALDFVFQTKSNSHGRYRPPVFLRHLHVRVRRPCGRTAYFGIPWTECSGQQFPDTSLREFS